MFGIIESVTMIFEMLTQQFLQRSNEIIKHNNNNKTQVCTCMQRFSDSDVNDLLVFSVHIRRL